MIDEDKELAIRQFVNFSNATDDENYDLEDGIKMKDVMAKVKIIQITGGMKPYEIRSLPKKERYELLKTLIEEHHIQKTVLERLTGISRKTMLEI